MKRFSYVQIAALIGLAAVLTVGTQPIQAQEGGFVKEFGTMWTFDAPPLDYWEGLRIPSRSGVARPRAVVDRADPRMLLFVCVGRRAPAHQSPLCQGLYLS